MVSDELQQPELDPSGGLEPPQADREHEGEEGQQVKEVKFTSLPTEQEVRLHNLHHIPFRDWCPYCIMGKATNPAHYRRGDSECSKPVISIDYMGISQREPGDGDNPIIVVHDRLSKTHFAHMLPQKGIHPYAVNRLCQDLSKIFGYTSFILKSDQEPAILALKKAV